jgi:hypothetical protein
MRLKSNYIRDCLVKRTVNGAVGVKGSIVVLGLIHDNILVLLLGGSMKSTARKTRMSAYCQHHK